MVNFRNKNGITLMAEVLTVVVLMMIVSVISYSSMSSLQVKALNNMYTDIVNIQEKAANYYQKYGEAPVDKTQKITGNLPTEELNSNDDLNSYYKIDFNKLLNVTLNNSQTTDNYYYMNEKTLITYYSKGVTIDGLNGVTTKTYHTLPSNYENITKLELGPYQNEK